MNRLTAFLLGVWEFRTDVTTNLEDEGLQLEYDWGREWAHRITLRRYETE